MTLRKKMAIALVVCAVLAVYDFDRVPENLATFAAILTATALLLQLATIVLDTRQRAIRSGQKPWRFGLRLMGNAARIVVLPALLIAGLAAIVLLLR